jgi:hypothetical protein
MLQSELHAESSGEVLREVLDSASGEVLLVNPSRETMAQLIAAFRRQPPPPPVRLLADRGPLKELADVFLTASTIADLVAGDNLGVRTLDRPPRHSLLATAAGVVSIVEYDGHAVGLPTTERAFIDATFEEYEHRWEQGGEFSFRTPPLSQIRKTLTQTFGQETAADFDRIIGVMGTRRSDDVHLDAVTIALLVTANNRELLYDVTRWAEEIDLASKATVSRTKNRLEESGILDTEKEPIDVGRPRQRLQLGSPKLRKRGIEEVARRTQAAIN